MSPFFVPFQNGLNTLLWCCLHNNVITDAAHINSDVDDTCKHTLTERFNIAVEKC